MLRAWMSPRAALFSAFCVLLSSACKDGSLDVVGTVLANAGTDRTVEVGVSVGLDASLSRDPRGAGLTFRWTLERRPPGSVVVLQGAESVFASFTPDAVGAYGVALWVSNGMAAASASLVVTAVPRSGDLTPPVATITLTPDNPSRDRDPRFAFTSSKPNSRFECTLDGNAPAPCTSPRASYGPCEPSPTAGPAR